MDILAPHANLGEFDVHVWLANLDTLRDDARAFEYLLATDERQRADRFRFATDRVRYIVGRGLLRILLGRYLDCSPTALEFQYSQYGKPTLFEHPQVYFNISHAGSYALFGFALNREIGIDIEFIKPDFDIETLAGHFFSEQEIMQLKSVSAEKQHAAFFACWTRKEAYIKARGAGLSLPLSGFDVAFLPGEPAQLIATRPDASEAHRWKMTDLDVPNGYRGALIVEGTDWQLSRWKIPECHNT